MYAPRHHRISLFDDEGTWLADRRLETNEAVQPWLGYRVVDAADGTLTLTTTRFVIATRQGEAASDQTIDNPQLRFATDGTFLGEVAEPNTLRLYASGTELDSRLFGGHRAATAGGGRVYVRDPGAYEVRVYGRDGNLERVHRLARARRPVADDDVKRYREHLRSTIDDSDVLARALERIDRQPRADSFPSIRDLHVDRLGDIWVTEYIPPWEERGTTTVFAADGPWLGTLEMPPEFEPLEIGEDYLLGVLTDELDVQRLVLYELER